jgi:cysteine desulfurase
VRVYLDHNATSPLRPEAKAAIAAMLERCGNASSVHAEGRAARAAIDDSREALARAVGADPRMIVFTSGGSEANTMAMTGTDAKRLLVSAIEHPSVLEAAHGSGKAVELIPVTGEGVVDLDALDRMLPGPRALVSVMLANNETGVIQPVAEIARRASSHGAIVHTDAVQCLGKIPVNMPLLGVDMMTLSAHKLGGPAGVGALVIRDGLAVSPLIRGGGQELRRRAGTENLAGIAGFAAAMSANVMEIRALRDELESRLEGAVVIGREVPRLPNTTCIALPGHDSETLVMAFDLEGVAVSAGSACSSGKVAASHVLAAMGLPEEISRAAIRVSLGWNTTADDIEKFAAAWRRIAARRKAKAAA